MSDEFSDYMVRPILIESYIAHGADGETQKITFGFFENIGWSVNEKYVRWAKEHGHKIVFPEVPTEHQETIDAYYKKIQGLMTVDFQE